MIVGSDELAITFGSNVPSPETTVRWPPATTTATGTCSTTVIVIECGKLADAVTDLTSGYAAAVLWNTRRY